MKIIGKGVSSAEWKMREAEFFYAQMKANTHRSLDFPFYTSAFLSALKSCTEHNRLFSADGRFKDWYRQLCQSLIKHPDLVRLFGLRNQEIHHNGADGYQIAGFDLPMGVTLRDVELKVETRDRSSVLMVKLPGRSVFEEARNVVFEWIWDVPGKPKVLELCYAGLGIIRQVVESRRAMNFAD